MKNENEDLLVGLRAIRQELIDELDHHLNKAKTYTAATSPIVLTSVLAENESIYYDFKQNKKDINMSYSQEIKGDNLAAFKRINMETTDKYHELKRVLTVLLPVEEHERTIHQQTINEQERHFKLNINLPSIGITKFTGNFDDWDQFKDTFESMINQNNELTECQKLLYLKSSLKFEPLNIIKNLKATNENFSVAWSLLEERYQHKRKMFEANFKAILELPMLIHESYENLKKMLDTYKSHMYAIEAQGIPVDSAQPFIIYLLTQKFDSATKKNWAEELKGKKDLPTKAQLIEFLEIRISILEGIEANQYKSFENSQYKPYEKAQYKHFNKPQNKGFENRTFPNNSNQSHDNQVQSFQTQTNEFKPKCTFCAGPHRPYECTSFREADLKQKYNLVVNKSLCINCLYRHHVDICKSKFTCNQCQAKHHSMLHGIDSITVMTQNVSVQKPASYSSGARPKNNTNTRPDPIPIIEPCSDTETYTCHLKQNTNALLGTALIPVYNKGRIVYLRTLIDNCSMGNFISARGAQKLQLTQNKMTPTNVTGMKKTVTNISKAWTNFFIGSIHNEKYKYNINAFIVDNITDVNPKHTYVQLENWPHLHNLPMADPNHFKPGQIDLLLGVEAYGEIIQSGVKKGKRDSPIAQCTKLGWLILGSVNKESNETQECFLNFTEATELSNQLKLFWSIEEDVETKHLTAEEELCEKRFIDETIIRPDGKFEVKLPFKIPTNSKNFLGNSYNQAEFRLLHLEKRFTKNPEMKVEYSKILNEYIDLGHMHKATEEEKLDTKNAYYMPHHAVIKESSTTTKVRVVCDASAKSSNGFSLNDRLLIGPTVQEDIFSILIRWRIFKIGFIADIEKMYRMIMVNAEDAKFQRILWRNNSDEPIKQYVFNTVTFGTASAPYQATRALIKIAEEIEQTNEACSKILKQCCYVDDIVSGAHDEQTAKEISKDLIHILSQRGFNLRKWSSNSLELLQTIPLEHQEKMCDLELLKEFKIKALGIQWSPSIDQFSYISQIEMNSTIDTKRQFISNMSKFYDPLGWISAVIIRIKILAQHLWTRGIDWDHKIPNDINEKWQEIRIKLPEINNIRIDRWIKYSPTYKNISIHAFCDASELAYAAVVYLRIETNTVYCNLLAAKAKVAPLKKVTTPKLELMSAVLLTKVVRKIQHAMNLGETPTYAWCDSQIALSWIYSHPSRWKTFIANRITTIHETIPAENWRHVPTKLNPADHGSRGIPPEQLKDLKQWWEGPEFLQNDESMWPEQTHDIKTDLEEKKDVRIFVIRIKENIIHRLIDAYNDLQKMARATAYWLRTIYKVKKDYKYFIQPIEYNRALIVLARCTQETYFHEELKCLKINTAVSKNSKLASFTPILDENKLIRILGRLQKADLNENQKHQIILPANCKFTQVLIDDAHERTMHGGAKLTIQYLRNQWWILNVRTVVKNQNRKCVTCTRYRGEAAKQLMGNLPSYRVQINHPFIHTGIDFAGYFEIKTSNLRKASMRKCYISLFICMVTKAIHLELASSLSTEDFLACLKRFTSRRGLPAHIYSDNGTNFIGASNKLPQLLRDSSAESTKIILNEMAKKGIQWHFNPPKGAHFGGIWESNIKSTKYHLKRVLGETKLVYEDYETILTQIEAILNSRPLCKLTDSAEDYETLTPAHFLIGRTPISLPQPCVLEIPLNRLDHYQFLQRIVQEYWKEWSKEYLLQLQQRNKWKQIQENVQIGQIVLIIDDNQPPAQWAMGKIIEVFPGEDKLIRVVNIKTQNGIFKRPIHKLCILPVKDENKTGKDPLNN